MIQYRYIKKKKIFMRHGDKIAVDVNGENGFQTGKGALFYGYRCNCRCKCCPESFGNSTGSRYHILKNALECERSEGASLIQCIQDSVVPSDHILDMLV